MKNGVLLQQVLFQNFTGKIGSVKQTVIYLTDRYFVCHPKCVAELWEENLMLLRPNPTCWSANSIWKPLPQKLILEHQFPLFSYLSNLNNRKWDNYVHITKFFIRFLNSCRFYSGSPRNRNMKIWYRSTISLRLQIYFSPTIELKLSKKNIQHQFLCPVTCFGTNQKYVTQYTQ